MSTFTVREIAAQVRDELAADDEAMALRLLLDGVARLARHLADEDDVAALLAEPDPIGEERWDALLGGAVAHVCRRHGVRIPAWTRRNTLPTWWWPGDPGASRARIMQRTPMDLERLGIWLDAKELQSA